MSDKPANTIFTKAAYLAARERFLKKLAARQAAEKIIARIVAGEPRETFGAFALSFEDIEGRQCKGTASQSLPDSGAGRAKNLA
jgi:hypothetical protein